MNISAIVNKAQSVGSFFSDLITNNATFDEVLGIAGVSGVTLIAVVGFTPVTYATALSFGVIAGLIGTLYHRIE